MYCPDCGGEMTEEINFDDMADVIEALFECIDCGTIFHGTLYRSPIT